MTKADSFGTYDPAIAAEFVKKWEGLSLKAYRCPAGVLTIGYGHTSGVYEGQVISQEEADELLLGDLTKTRNELLALIAVPVTEGQFVAIMSLAFNLGARNLVRTCPKLIRALNSYRVDDCVAEFADVVFVNGKKSQGLVRRRTAEVEKFNDYLD